jgi:membrane protein implicated in regulation of membrane protease activity
MAAIVGAGIAAAFIAQGIGLSFRVSIVMSALLVGVLISVLHYFQDSRRSTARLRERRTTIITTITTEEPNPSRAAHR